MSDQQSETVRDTVLRALTRNEDLAWLVAEVPADDRAYADQRWQHNEALYAYMHHHARPAERAFIALFLGLRRFVDLLPFSGYFECQQIGQMLTGAHPLLSEDMGRLDGRTMDEALNAVADTAGWDLNLNQPLVDTLNGLRYERARKAQDAEATGQEHLRAQYLADVETLDAEIARIEPIVNAWEARP